MNIWYVNHYAREPTEGDSNRSTFLAGVLRSLGHNPVIVAGSCHHLRPDAVPRERSRRLLDFGGPQLFFLPTRAYRGNGVTRWLNMRDFARGISSLEQEVARGSLPRPDVIIASSAHLFTYPPARNLAARLGARIIFEVRDIWPLSLVEVAGIHPWHPIVVIMDRIERSAYRTADAVVSLLPNALVHMEPRGLDSSRFHWIPNGIWASEWQEESSSPLPAEYEREVQRRRDEGKLVVVYAGAHGPPNALGQVLDLVRVPGTKRPYHFFLVGEGILKPSLEERARREGIDFVTFLPQMRKRTARALIGKADVCFIGWQNRPIYRFGISANKLFEYLMAAKPVLHAIDGCDDPVRNSGAGIVVPPYEPRQLDEALRKLAAMSPLERQKMGERGRAHVVEHYEWSVLGRRYATLCEQLVAGATVTAQRRTC
jgi:glycosyltransferase involved in cell wall biosynthesis